MIDATTPGLSRCSRCKRHNAGRLWLVSPPDGRNGEIVCNDPVCIRAVSARIVDPGARPYDKVRCTADCDHPAL